MLFLVPTLVSNPLSSLYSDEPLSFIAFLSSPRLTPWTLFCWLFHVNAATCHVNHIPPYIKQVDAFKAKGVDQIIVLAQNDPFVMSAWGVQNKAEDKVIFATDLNLEFSQGIGSTADLSAMGFGQRTGRYALIVDDLKVVDFSAEPNPGAVEVSGADHVLAKL